MKKNSKARSSKLPTARTPSAGKLPRTPFAVNTLLEDEGDGSGEFDTPRADITQAELEEFLTVSVDLRRLLERYGVSRRDLVRRLQSGAAVEPGPMSVELSDMPAAMFQWWLVERALAAVHANYLKGEHLDGEVVRLRVTGKAGPRRAVPSGEAASPFEHLRDPAGQIAEPPSNKRPVPPTNPFAGMKDI